MLSLNLFALEVTLQGAKENFINYSTLHIKDPKDFLCENIKDDFDETIEVVCAFATKPSSEFRDLQNNFFKITSQVKKKTFFLIIRPVKKMKIYPMVFDFSKEDTLYKADVKMSKHWMLVGYKEKAPFIKDEIKSDLAINFPFFLSSDRLPYVGGLDIKGNPIHIKKVRDVKDYLKIKKYYAEGKYELCLELIDEVQVDYPNSLFTSEFLYYKIKTFGKLDDYDNIILSAKHYFQEYSSDENVPEVLALNAMAYAKIGLNTDADYFFDRLFSEHVDSEFSNWGYIYKAEMLEASGSAIQAAKFYEKALNDTQEIDIAVDAAFKLARLHIGASDEKEASKYAQKVIASQPEFFFKNLKQSMDMMYSFAQEMDFKTAADIAKSLSDATTKEHDEYERLLRDRAIWLSKTDAKLEALEAINAYLDIYSDGVFEEEISVAKDALFFDTSDANSSAKLAELNELIDTYRDDTIGNRATYEKAQLLLQEGMFGDILAMKDDILALDMDRYEDKESIVESAAVGMMKVSLKTKECESVILISSEYKIELSDEWDDGIYECAMMGGDFTLSKKIATKNLKLKDLEQRKKWLYRYVKVDFATGNYSEVLGASKDLILLIEDDENSPYVEIYRYLFDTYQRLEKNDKLLDSINTLKKEFGLTYKDLDRYVAVMSIGSQRKDDNIVIKYAQEVMQIQNASSSYPQSPFVEFTLYQAYINIDENNRALEVIKSLDNIELSKKDRARQKYMLGTIYSKLWRSDDAMKAYDEAIAADENSAWARLAKSAKEI